MRLNPNFRKLPGGYLFSEVARRVAEYTKAYPRAELLHLGIGDVTHPLAPAVVSAMQAAAAELGEAGGFRGYGPEQGYAFLRRAIAEGDFQSRGVDISPEEICVSDGAKSDCGGIGDLLAADSRVAVCDPVYPAYADVCAMTGRAGDYDRERGLWSGLVYLPCLPENGFVPLPPEEPVDMVWLCFPNNPTGAVATGEQLRAWVDYANGCGALLLFDAAYEAFITAPGLPHSIFEVPGARTCAIEFRSFSKTAGFTGVRCAAAVIPRQLRREGLSLLELWKRRQSARYNGTSYISQRGAEAVYTQEGRRQTGESIAAYLRAAGILRRGLARAGLTVYGGENAPYVWVRGPDGLESWAFFDLLLRQAGVVSTPGIGFGPGGRAYVRLSAFCGPETAERAVTRIQAAL